MDKHLVLTVVGTDRPGLVELEQLSNDLIVDSTLDESIR
jgi:hypothetical protein